MLKLKFQYIGHLMKRTDSSEKTLMLGKIEGGRRRGWQRMRWLMASLTRWTWVWVGSGSWRTGKPGMPQSWHTVAHRVSKSQTRLSDWTELNWDKVLIWVTWIIQHNLLILRSLILITSEKFIFLWNTFTNLGCRCFDILITYNTMNQKQSFHMNSLPQMRARLAPILYTLSIIT